MGFFDFLKDARTPQRIRQCTEDMILMLNTAEEIFLASTQYALENQALSIDLKAKDKVVNEKEVEIRRTMHEHLKVDPWHDLTYCMTLISIVHDAERIGDLGKSIAKVADMAHKNRLGPHVVAIREIRDMVDAQFPMLKAGFVDNDENKARAVMSANIGIKAKTTEVLNALANDASLSPNESVVLALLARMIGRVASHLSNVASSVAMPFDQIRRSATWGDDDS
jgi:phosphate uptake regulator